MQYQRAPNPDQALSHGPGTDSRRLGFAAQLAAFVLGSVFFMPTVSDAVLGLFLLFAVLAIPEKHQLLERLSSDRLLWCAGALLAYLALSCLWSQNLDGEEVTKLALRIVFILSFLLVVASAVRDKPGFHVQLCRYVALGALVSALICLYSYYDNPPADGRMLGMQRFNNTGRAGRIITAALPFALACLYLDRVRWRLLGLLSLCVGLFALVQTGTRAAWLAAGVSSVVYILLSLEQRPKRIAAIAGACALAFLAAVGIILSNPEWAHAAFPRGDSFRFDIWAGHWRDITQQAPLLGWGHLTDHRVMVGAHDFRGAHNMYLSTAGHIGLPGLVVFLVLLGWTAQRLFSNIQLPQARLGLCLLLAGCAAFIFSGDRLIDKVNFVWFVLWLPLAMALSVSPAGDTQTSDPVSR